MFLHFPRFGHSFENHVNRRLRILILRQVMTQALQGESYVTWPQPLGRCSFQDRSDFIGQGRLLKQVRGLYASVDGDALTFTQAGQRLKRLPNKDGPLFHLLLLGKKIGQLLLGGFVSLLIIGGGSHVDQHKQT